MTKEIKQEQDKPVSFHAWYEQFHSFIGKSHLLYSDLHCAWEASRLYTKPQPNQENTDWEAVAADQALTIALLKAELEQDEPVGKVSDHDWSTGLLYRDLEPGTPLYTTPQPRKPLTDEQKKNIFLKFYGKHWAYTNQIKNVMEAVEAAHGIKENT